MAHDVRTYRRIIVQTAAAWPTSDVGWTTRENLSAPAAAERWSLEIGDAKLAQRYGWQKQPGETAVGSTAMTPELWGRYLRLLKRDEAGPVSLTLSDGVTTRWSPFWWGEVIEVSRDQDNADTSKVNGIAEWLVAGLLYDLDVHPKRGHELGKTTAGAVVVNDPGYCLGFNCRLGGTDRSSITWGVGSRTVYVHDRQNLTGFPWTARQVADYLLALRALDGGAPWQLSGQITDSLNFSEKWELNGLTYLTRLGRVIAPRRGLGFRCIVRNHIPYLHVTTTTNEVITVTPYSLKANEAPTTLDVRGKHHIKIEKLREDHSAVLDELGCEGKHPWVARTFKFPDDLDKGWTTDEETAWEAATAEAREDESLCHVHRRYLLKRTPTTTWVNNKRTLVTSDEYGVDGEDGEQTADDTVGLTSQALKLTRKLPLYAGYDYTASAPTAPDKTRPLQDPRLFFNSGSAYIDYSTMFTITVDDDAAAVILGGSAEDGQRISRLTDTYGGEFYVTVGVLEPLPLRVLWRRDPAEWPRASPRRRMYPVHEAELWRVAAGTVLAAGSTTATGGIVRDDRSILRSVLALARPWVEGPAYEVQWIDRSTIDIAEGLHPGAFLRAIILGDQSIAVSGVITSREWSMTEDDCFTRYTTKRILPDLRGIL